MKKITAIFFLFLYINAAFGIGIDYHFCGGKLADVKLHAFGNTECKCSPKQMDAGCCKNVTIRCKTDNHKFQSPTIVVGFSFSKLVSNYPAILKFNISSPDFVKEFGYHYCYFIRSKSSREILAFISILRI